MRSREIDLKMPPLEADDDAYDFIRWLVTEGDAVVMDQDIAELMTPEGLFRLPSPLDGQIIELLAEPAETITPGQRLAVIREE